MLSLQAHKPAIPNKPLQVIVKTLSGTEYQFELSDSATIEEVRQKLSDLLKLPITEINIKNIMDNEGNRLGTIFRDDPGNIKLVDFIKNENKSKQFKLDKLIFYITLFFDNRHVRHMPKVTLSEYKYYDSNCKLVALLHKHNMGEYNWKSEESKKILNELLSNKTLAEHPNKKSQDGFTGIGTVLVFHDIDLLKQLLWYGGDPRLDQLAWNQFRETLQWFVKFSMTVPLSLKEKYAVIEDFFSPPKKPIRKNNLILNKLQELDDRLHYEFESNNEPVEYEFVPVNKLTDKQIDEIFNVYRIYFEPSPVINSSLREFFNSEIEGKNKFFELMWYKGKLAGVNLYEVITDPKYPDHVFVHVSCIFVIEQLRGRGLTDPLVLALAHSMPKLFENKKIVCLYQSISLGSARLINGLTYFFPKHNTPFIKAMAECMIHHIQRKPNAVAGPLLANEPGESWTPIEVQVTKGDSKEAPTKTLSINDAFFDPMRGVKDVKNQSHHGALIMFYVTDETWKKMLEACLKMNFDIVSFINFIAKGLVKLIPDLNPKYVDKPVYLPRHAILFKENRIVLSDTFIPSTTIELIN